MDIFSKGTGSNYPFSLVVQFRLNLNTILAYDHRRCFFDHDKNLKIARGSNHVNPSLIITHPGSSHFDEFFAVSLILAVYNREMFHVERREPLPGELANPNIWVVDIGGQHDPMLKNFDHHQSLDVQSSFMLVADYLKVSQALSVFPWWDFKDGIDRFGPTRMGEEMGGVNLTATYSPFEEWYLTLFAQEPGPCLPLMKAFGQSMLEQANALLKGMEFWQNARRVSIKQKICLVGETFDLTGAEEYCDRLDSPFSMTVSYDKRGEGWTLKRYKDDPGVDFSLISAHPTVKFAHPGGFIAKTRERIPLDDVLALAALAVK